MCSQCHQIVTNRFHMFQERLIYRRVDGMAIESVDTLRHVCRDCLPAARARRLGIEAVGKQGALL